ncbi:MAG: prepilin-type N-terminal cleavage/methylation domain-containing protein [Planctomycetota bacterium]
MQSIRMNSRRGFTLIEVMTATVLVVIIIFGIAVMFYNGQRGWNTMYDSIYSDVVTEGYIARNRFDAVVRKSSIQNVVLDESGQSVEVYYYEDPNSTALDRYAHFYQQGPELYIECGKLDPRETLSVNNLCNNVSVCNFKLTGRSLQMLLTLNNGSKEMTTVTSAVLHNY